jgi:hypothetical protein
LAELEVVNQRVSDARVQWSNARTQRDNALYNNEDSVYQVVRLVKNYLCSVFGFNSIEYEQVKRISVTKF